MKKVKLTQVRGNALVLAVLILLSGTSVGILAVQRTNTDLQVAGNISKSIQSQQAGNSCITYGMKKAEKSFMLDIPTKLLKARGDPQQGGDPAHPVFRPTFVQFSTTLADPDSNKASFQATVGGDDPIARIGQDMACAAHWFHVREIRNKGGYQVDDICNQVIGFDGIGGIPNSPLTVPPSVNLSDLDKDLTEEMAAEGDTVMVQSRIESVIGPTPCYQR
jgi:hypothetical protein